MSNGPSYSDFSDTSPDAIVAECRQTSLAKKSAWDVPCVLKILCKQDKNVVQDLHKLNITKYDRIQFMDHVYDGKQWVLDPFEAGGTAKGNNVTVLSGESCESAATTLYHEWWHTTQPESMNHCDKEREAYTKTEEWTIIRGLEGQGQGLLRKVDPALGLRYELTRLGKEAVEKVTHGATYIPDKDAIEAVVKTYPGCGQSQTSNDPFPVGFDAKRNQTLELDPVRGEETWRPSRKDDRVEGKAVRTPRKPIRVPKSAWQCP
jgi:hypothetical protein